MEIVGVKSTVGRAVKCVDPGKTTRSESAWLGYSLCEYHIYIYISSHTPLDIYIYLCVTLYNEERRLGDQRGSDTLVVPLFTSNDGLSFAQNIKFYFICCENNPSRPTKNSDLSYAIYIHVYLALVIIFYYVSRRTFPI